MRRFTALQPGDAIALVSPGSMADPAEIAEGRAVLEAQGFRAVPGANLDKELGYLAGTDAKRTNLHF